MSLPADALFQNAFEHAAIGMALVATDGRWLKVNRSLCDLVGYSEADLLALTFQDITHAEDLDLDLARVGEMMRGEIQTYQMEKRYRHKAGHLVWVLLSVSLVRGEKGEPQYFISQIQDITARKHAEAANDAIFHLAHTLHYVAGMDGYFKRVSESWTPLLGHSLENLLATPYLEFVHPDDRTRTSAEIAKVVTGTNHPFFENRFRHADGSYRWMLWASCRSREGDLIFGMAIDYTDRKSMELALGAALAEKDLLLTELQDSTRYVQELRRKLLTVCAWTKRVLHEGEWISIDEFMTKHLNLRVTHGISEEARDSIYGELRREKR